MRFFEVTCEKFSSLRGKKAASKIVQQGDVNVNGTPTAFNPDLSHTHRRRVLLKLLQFLCQREKFSFFLLR